MAATAAVSLSAVAAFRAWMKGKSACRPDAHSATASLDALESVILLKADSV